MLVLGTLLLLVGVFAVLAHLGVISLADPTARRRLLDKRTLSEAQEEHRRFKMIETSTLAKRVYRPQTLQKIERKIVVAGHPSLWTIRNLMIGKVVLPIFMVYMCFIFGFVQAGGFLLFLTCAVAVVSWFVPNILVGARATERTQFIERALPDLLDKLHIALKAGLSFDAALSESLKTSEGPLTDELIRTMQDIRVGMPRRDAYDALRLRTEAPALHTFIRSIQQAEAKGTSISTIVAHQAKELRMVRRMVAEGKAQQVSVKLLAPLMTCIFPVLFIIIIAPAILGFDLDF